MLVNDELIRFALEEDIGSGDVTTEGLVDLGAQGRGVIVAKEPCVVVGLPVAAKVFAMLDPNIRFQSPFSDGDEASKNDEVVQVSGSLHALLTGERTALNFLQHLSGIGTLARRFAKRVAGAKVRVTDTRKTTPGWRRLEKYAVRMGGAANHRFGLYDGILIKDNHIKACGGITRAVERMRAGQAHLLRIEVEVSNFDELDEALKCGVEIIMLDNMSLPEIKKAITHIQGRALVEVSGGVTLETVADLAATGVNIISVGAITHSAKAIDMSMRILE
jgi:nicotinate-nucleotide pyrophosphorylase (carboxylating)